MLNLLKRNLFFAALALTAVLLFFILLTTACGGSRIVDDEVPSSPSDNNEVNDMKIKVEPAQSDVGIWYSVWYTYNGDYGNNIQTNIWKNWDIQYKPLLPDGTYGYYDSLDEDIINYHLEQISEAGIDFLIFDQTNNIDAEGGMINKRALKVAQCIKAWNDSGNRPIKYCSAIGKIQWDKDGKAIEDEAVLLYNRYLKEDFGDAYYMLDGKPLLIVYGDGASDMWNSYLEGGGKSKYTDRFTLRWADNQSTPGYYGWAIRARSRTMKLWSLCPAGITAKGTRLCRAITETGTALRGRKYSQLSISRRSL